MKRKLYTLFLCLGLSMAVLAIARHAQATLGESADSVASDQKALKAVKRATTVRNGYTVHEFALDGTVVREYVSPSGIVFGIAWNGLTYPDLTPLLGSYAGEYQAALQQTPRKPGLRRHQAREDGPCRCRKMGAHAQPAGPSLRPGLNPSGGERSMKSSRIRLFILILGLVIGCGGGGGSGSSGGGGTPPAPAANNVLLVTVNGSLCSNNSFLNKACVSVTVCTPGTATCQTINDIVLDTGSFGLRIFKQALNVPLAQVSSGSGSLAECIQFADGSSDWGPVQTASVILGNEPAVQVPIQVIDSTFGTVPSQCGIPHQSPVGCRIQRNPGGRPLRPGLWRRVRKQRQQWDLLHL